MEPSRRQQRIMAILWPSFLMAGVLEMLVFAVVDPSTLHWFGGEAVGLSVTAVYTVTFFIFWGVIATAGLLSALLTCTAQEINEPDSVERPARRMGGHAVTH